MNLSEALKVNGKITNPNYSAGTYTYLCPDMPGMFRTYCPNVPNDRKISDSFYLCEGAWERNDWVPFKEPCKHEPIVEDTGVLVFKRDSVDKLPFGSLVYKPICKHCGVKLKAKEWVEDVR